MLGHPLRVPSELVDALASRRCTAVVGNGASIPSGIPSWKELLRRCLEDAEANDGPVVQARARFNEGDLLMAAELLSVTLGPERLHALVQSIVGSATRPSPVHFALARLPFRALITTNFDELLERAYADRPLVFTWRQGDTLLTALRKDQFFIVKSHGTGSDPNTFVLTRSHFRDKIEGNDSFAESMRHLLLTSTLLFVGHSLKDLDLLHLMDVLHGRFKNSFGPHYALLPESGVDDSLETHLDQSYNIRVIKFRDAMTPVSVTASSTTPTVEEFLCELSGKVASKNRGSCRADGLGETLYYLEGACKTLATRACTLTGSKSCSIYVEHSRSLRRLVEVASYRGSSFADRQAGATVPSNSLEEQLYLRTIAGHDCIVIGSRGEAAARLSEQGFDGSRLRWTDATMKSLLAYPVYSDGHRSGVVVIESDIEHAYTRDHSDALSAVAREVGWALDERSRRQLSDNLLSAYTSPDSPDAIKKFDALIKKSRVLRTVDLSFILYRIDHLRGQMDALCPRFPKKHFSHSFSAMSLAGRVLATNRAIAVDDVWQAMREGKVPVDERGLREFRIRGPVVGVPVNARGYTSAVLVAWSAAGETVDRKLWRFVPERLQRMANLIANDPSLDGLSDLSAGRFIDGLNNAFRRYDHGKPWTNRLVIDHGGSLVEATLDVLVSDAGLKRVRLWREIPEGGTRTRRVPKEIGFVCTASLTSADATVNGRPVKDAYRGVATRRDDVHCQYTLHRATGDRYARTQHKSMFNNRSDTNNAILDKDPSGFWIVAPIWHNRDGLLGFLSADNQVVDADKDRVTDRNIVSPQVRGFQRRAMDLVTDLLAIALRCDGLPLPQSLRTSDGPVRTRPRSSRTSAPGRPLPSLKT